jgi:hypothetical protein
MRRHDAFEHIFNRDSLGGVGVLDVEVAYPFLPQLFAGKVGAVLLDRMIEQDLIGGVIIKSAGRAFNMVVYHSKIGSYSLVGPALDRRAESAVNTLPQPSLVHSIKISAPVEILRQRNSRLR